MAMADDLETKRLVKETFRKFDANGDGSITREELGKVLRRLVGEHSFQETAVDELLGAADQNKDGRIQYDEFVDWVMHGQASQAPRGPSLDYRTLLPERFEVDVSKRYNLDKLALGEGGYGKVFIAKDTRFQNRLVAVKKVTKTADSKRTQTFYTEIGIMKELDHPNICKLFETFEIDQSIFYVMEYCEGGELFEKIIKMKRIDEGLTVDIIAQVSAALRYAHGRNIAHRDIKPENVVFCTKNPEDRNVKLIDWGLGIDWADGPMKAAVGSFTYAAPEVITSRNTKAYTSACDLWSLGVLTYVMLSGRPPFWGRERDQHRAMMREHYPISGRDWDPISREAKDFIKKLMKATPTNRMPIDDVVQHPWLTATSRQVDTSASSRVLANLTQFSNMDVFGAVCIASVARQLDHRKLANVHTVFRQMDKNGDGVLSIEEVSEGFGKIFGADSPEYEQVMQTFRSLDLDGSMFIDYTEFCAASLGQHMAEQDEALWAAFKVFDVDNSDRISKDEFLRVLDRVDVREAWSDAVCADACEQVLTKFDADGDGQVNYQEWLAIMQTCWSNRQEAATAEAEAEDDGSKLGKLRETRSALSAYDLLLQVSKLSDEEAVQQ